MALEKSVLNEETIADLLLRHYGIPLVSVHRLKLGSANCYRVSDGNKDYFLKEFQSFFSDEAVIREAKLLEFLYDADIPVTRFYRTLDNEFVIRYKDHSICLEEYVDGQSYGYNDLPPELLPSIARMLGKIHSSLKNYQLPAGMSGEWLSSFSAEKTIDEYDRLIYLAKSKAHDINITRIIDDLEYKKQLALRCEDYKKYYDGVTYCATHGDYQGCQLIFSDDEIKAVVDFSSARTLPVTWEIMRSFVQSSESCRRDATIDIDAFFLYIREYMKFFALTRADLVSMPYIYLFQLARSKFGYSQYLTSDSDDKIPLLEFGFWRTQMCREVEEKAEMIAQKLSGLL